MKRVIFILALAFGLGHAKSPINTMGATTITKDGTRVTALISAGYARFFIHEDDLKVARRVIICEALYKNIIDLDLEAWDVLEDSKVTFEKGFKKLRIGNTNEYLNCVGVGD